MSRGRALLRAAALVWALQLVTGTAWADNCGSPADCFGAAGSFTTASYGLLALVGLSLLLDFLPVVGTGKGIVEAVTGRDLVTGEELAWWERALGVVPVVGGLAAVGSVARAADTVGDLARGGDAAGDVIRGGDAAVDVARGADAAGHLPTGARYVEAPDSPRAGRIYDEIRAASDTAAVADRTGIDRRVVDQVHDHLFRREHDLPVGPGRTERGSFTPDDQIADLWRAAENGTLTPEQARDLRQLVTHEYVESRLMDLGLPYRSAHPDAWTNGYNSPTPQQFGAHDLAPRASYPPGADPFSHYGTMDRATPGVGVADDLSNLDDLVRAILGGG